ncbi:hypothetical protein [Paenibacillus sp. BIHB 4019]|nr:hypothetical protein [Paenibacillus sp. BIHB 4019]
MAFVVRMKHHNAEDFDLIHYAGNSKDTLTCSESYNTGENDEDTAERMGKIDAMSESECQLLEQYLLNNLSDYLHESDEYYDNDYDEDTL